jgi:threonine synthase
MSARASRLVCSGCGAAPPPDEPYPFRCPKAGVGDVDHVLMRVLDLDRVRFPSGADGDQQPFVRYRGLLHSYHRAVAAGMTDEDFTTIVRRLDDAVRAVDGRGFATTPFGRVAVLSDRLGFRATGGVWVKDETGNVAGSHKARHLMGVLLHLEVAERLGLADPGARPDLAIASCGNAALAAAVLARAAGRRLRVFVPVDADPVVMRSLRELGADVVACARPPDVPGDPCFARLRDEVARGAIPFTCQGSENGLVIEGGQTLGYEIVTDLLAHGGAVDDVVVQVGGGALASACGQSLREAVGLGVLGRMPRVHAVQTVGGHPLDRAYRKVRDLLPDSPSAEEIAHALHTAAIHRSAFMWPWPEEPQSSAGGILDDETYDWRSVVGGLLESGGRSIVVSEDRVAQAHRLGRAAGVPVDPTGTAGLAGLLDLVADGVVGPDDRVVVLFTGVDRSLRG